MFDCQAQMLRFRQHKIKRIKTAKIEIGLEIRWNGNYAMSYGRSKVVKKQMAEALSRGDALRFEFWFQPQAVVKLLFISPTKSAVTWRVQNCQQSELSLFDFERQFFAREIQRHSQLWKSQLCCRKIDNQAHFEKTSYGELWRKRLSICDLT